MRLNGSVKARIVIASTMLLAANGGHAQFVPPSGFSGQGDRPGVAAPTDPTAPALTRLPNNALADRFAIVPGYKRGASTGHVEIVGAFEIKETDKRHLIAAWSTGFLPITLSFDDGECYSLQADYFGGTLSNGRMSPIDCNERQVASEAIPPSPNGGSGLAFINSAWSYAAWSDKQAGTTIVTAPYTDSFKPLFTAKMATIAIMAMNGPDYPAGNVTLVGRVDGRLTVVTLEVGY